MNAFESRENDESLQCSVTLHDGNLRLKRMSDADDYSEYSDAIDNSDVVYDDSDAIGTDVVYDNEDQDISGLAINMQHRDLDLGNTEMDLKDLQYSLVSGWSGCEDCTEDEKTFWRNSWLQSQFEGCEVLEATETISSIKTPNFPQDYPSDMSKCYVIHSPSGLVNLTIQHLEMEESLHCTKDFVEIKAGQIWHSHLIDRLMITEDGVSRLCGNLDEYDGINNLSTFFYAWEIIAVRLVSDHQGQFSGVNMTYQVFLDADGYQLDWRMMTIVCVSIFGCFVIIGIIGYYNCKMNATRRFQEERDTAWQSTASVPVNIPQNTQGQKGRNPFTNWLESEV